MLTAAVTTHICLYLSAYLEFNVGQYRRTAVGCKKSHDFFHPHNQEALKQRK